MILKKQIRFINQNLLAPVFFELYKYTKNLKLIPIIRRLAKIQLKADQILRISTKLKECIHCNLLIFGLGNDSKYWILTNNHGNTYFIEDNELWYNKMTKKNPDLKAELVSYNTTMDQWKNIISSETDLQLDMPDKLKDIKWDIIFVDAPRGVSSNNPGRMKSIFMASKLIKPGGTVFVHDSHREVEKAYCMKYLKQDNLVNRIGTLDEYLIL